VDKQIHSVQQQKEHDLSGQAKATGSYWSSAIVICWFRSLVGLCWSILVGLGISSDWCWLNLVNEQSHAVQLQIIMFKLVDILVKSVKQKVVILLVQNAG